MTRNLSRRELLRFGAAAPLLVASPSSATEATGEGATVSGNVELVNGTPAPDAEVVAVSAAYRDESARWGVAGYNDDPDQQDLPAVRTRTDDGGSFSLDVSDIEPPRRVCAYWEDDDGETWFSPLREQSGTLTLSNHLLFPSQKAHTSTYGEQTDRPVPYYSGTVTAWRRIDPSGPRNQNIRIEMTETATGIVDRDAFDDESRQVDPWELTLDRIDDRQSQGSLIQYQHPPIENAIVSLTVPERIDDEDVFVEYDDVTVYEATEPIGRTTDEPVREAFTHWHPLRTPAEVPAFTSGAAREHYTPVDLESRQDVEDAANSWLSIIGILGKAAVGAVSGGAGLALTAAVAVVTGSDVTVSTGSIPGQPETVLGTKITDEMRPSRNTHDTVDRLWVDPPASFFLTSPVPSAASVVVDVPLRMPSSGTAAPFVLEAVWDSLETAGFSQKVALDPTKHTVDTQDGDPGDDSSDDKIDEYLSDANEYDGEIEDHTGEKEVTVEVGAGDNGFAFSPPAISIDPVTTVVWEWTGQGGTHNVVHEDSAFESKLSDEEGHTFEQTFEDGGTYLYYCSPHRTVGMRGAVVVDAGSNLDEREVRLGVLMPTSGALESLGTEIRDGAVLPADQLDAATDITVEVGEADTETDPDAAVDGAQELADDDYPAVVGPLVSNATLAVIEEVYEPEGVTACSPASTTPQINSNEFEDDGYFFRTSANKRLDSEAMVWVGYEDHGHETAAVVHLDTTYGELIADTFGEAFEKRGGTVTATVAVESGKSSYTELLDRALDDDPDLFVIVTFPFTAEQLFSDYYADFDTAETVLLSSGFKDESLPDDVDNPMDDVVGIEPIADGPHHDAFADRYEDAFDREPAPFSAGAYDSSAVLLLANAAAGENDGTAIRDAVRDVVNPGGEKIGPDELDDGMQLAHDGEKIEYVGASSTVDFDDNGDVTSHPYEIWEYGDDGIERIDVVTVRV